MLSVCLSVGFMEDQVQLFPPRRVYFA